MSNPKPGVGWPYKSPHQHPLGSVHWTDTAAETITAEQVEKLLDMMKNKAGNFAPRVPPGVHTAKTAQEKFADNIKLGGMIASRLRMNGQTLPFDHLYAAEMDEKVVVFIVQNGQHVTLEDNKDLFPSDNMMAQLRLLMK
jgi:hypothetical protein